MSATVSSSRDATPWLTVANVVSCGVVAALQIGKGAIALPMLQADFHLNLAAMGWVTGIFAILGLVGGMPSSAVVTRIGDRRAMLLGLAAIVSAASAGALSPSFPVLLASRVVEGLGFLLISVAGPAILQRVAAAGQRDIAFALWSCYMPVGIALAMFTGPFFASWRTIWWTSAALAAAFIVGTLFFVGQAETPASSARRNIAVDILAVLRQPGPLTMAVCFSLYSLMFFALFSFLPVLLMERMGVTQGIAGPLSGLAAAANIVGNLVAGYLLGRGGSRAALVAFACAAMGASALGIFLPVFGNGPTFALCLLFSAVGGLIPATLLSSAPTVAPFPWLTPMVVGLIMQGSNLSQVLGPVAVGSVINRYGWSAAAGIVIIAALLAMTTALALRRILPRAA